jgi:hypothetical protein
MPATEEGLCDYERQRLERMAQNRAKMEVGAVPTARGVHCYGLSVLPLQSWNAVRHQYLLM